MLQVWEGLNVVKTGRVMLGATNPVCSSSVIFTCREFCLLYCDSYVYGMARYIQACFLSGNFSTTTLSKKYLKNKPRLLTTCIQWHKLMCRVELNVPHIYILNLYIYIYSSTMYCLTNVDIVVVLVFYILVPRSSDAAMLFISTVLCLLVGFVIG